MDTTTHNFKLSHWLQYPYEYSPNYSYTYSPSEREIALELEVSKLNNQLTELHIRNHQLIENQSKIEQKARTQQRQHDAKVYAYWKQKAEKSQELAKVLDSENKALRSQKESLQSIVTGLMDKLVDRSRKLIAIKRILDGSSESCSE